MHLNRNLAIAAATSVVAMSVWLAATPDKTGQPIGSPGTPVAVASLAPMSYLGTAGGRESPSADELRRLVSELPADFQADVLLRLAAAPDARDGVDLVLRAYRLAPYAARRLPGLATSHDNASGDEIHPPQTAGLDQLSLQVRAARAMLALAPERGNKLSVQLPVPAMPACEAGYVDNPSVFYEFASASVPGMPARMAFALQVIGQARTEMDIAPVVKFVMALPALEMNDEVLLARSLSSLFARVRGNDVGYTTTELTLWSEMNGLLARFKGSVDARAELDQAFRNYVTAHLSAPRCPSSMDSENQQVEQRYVLNNGSDAAVVRTQETDDEPGAQAASDMRADVSSVIRHAGFATMQRLFNVDAEIAPSNTPEADNLLDVLNSAPVVAAAAADVSGSIQRTAQHELLRYLEYVPIGDERERAFTQLKIWLTTGTMLDHDRRLGDIYALARSARRWPDSAQRLQQLAELRDPVIKAYALLIQRGQFPEESMGRTLLPSVDASGMQSRDRNPLSVRTGP